MVRRVQREPSRFDLRVFAIGQAVFVSVGLWLFSGRPLPLPSWWVVASAIVGTIAVIGVMQPVAVSWYRAGWMAAVRPLQKIFSLVLLALVYYFVVTPIGLLLRTFRRESHGGWQLRKERPLTEHLWKMW